MEDQETYHLKDDGNDILSHGRRRGQIHVLTLDPVLGTDVCERISADRRLKRYDLICPRALDIRSGVEEIDRTTQETTLSRLIIFDVRRATLARLRKQYNAVVGYNRRDFNKLCFSLCIGDGPLNLFQEGHAVDLFVPHLAAHRVDFHPAAFFYDPFLHYEPNEIPAQALDDEFVIHHAIPKRLAPYFRNDATNLRAIRAFFRATEKDDQIRAERLRTLRHIYKKRIAQQFPGHEEEFKDLFSRSGLQLASEKMNLYPFHFEDWVHDLMQRARGSATLKG